MKNTSDNCTIRREFMLTVTILIVAWAAGSLGLLVGALLSAHKIKTLQCRIHDIERKNSKIRNRKLVS